MTPVTAAKKTVVLFSDIGCPWASLAVHRLRKARRELGLDGRIHIDHRCFPLELINHQGTPKSIVDAEVAVVGSHEPALGWQPWDRSELDYPSTTLLAMQAVQAAKDPSVGGLAVSEELDAALRHAWYAQSLSIHLFDVILAVAAEHTQADVTVLARVLRSGLPGARVFADWADAEQSEVQGSPHLFFADGTSVHNPGISLSWTRGQFEGLPRIEQDEPGVYRTLLTRAVGDQPS
jgi:predicted DsbA family dithiol-disulfide isomerase